MNQSRQILNSVSGASQYIISRNLTNKAIGKKKQKKKEEKHNNIKKKHNTTVIYTVFYTDLNYDCLSNTADATCFIHISPAVVIDFTLPLIGYMKFAVILMVHIVKAQNGKNLQTVWTQMRQLIMSCLIWIYTACHPLVFEFSVTFFFNFADINVFNLASFLALTMFKG